MRDKLYKSNRIKLASGGYLQSCGNGKKKTPNTNKIEKIKIDERYLEVVAGVLAVAYKDATCIPENSKQETHRVNLKRWKREAVFWIYKSNDFLEWCDVLGVSSLRIRRLVSEANDEY